MSLTVSKYMLLVAIMYCCFDVLDSSDRQVAAKALTTVKPDIYVAYRRSEDEDTHRMNEYEYADRRSEGEDTHRRNEYEYADRGSEREDTYKRNEYKHADRRSEVEDIYRGNEYTFVYRQSKCVDTDEYRRGEYKHVYIQTTYCRILRRVSFTMKVAFPIVIILGTFGNVMTILVFRTMLSDGFAFPALFIVLAITDLLRLLTTILAAWLDALDFPEPSPLSNMSENSTKGFCWAVICFRTLSTWLLMAMTFLRTLHIFMPIRMGRVRQRRLALIVITVLVAICLLFNLSPFDFHDSHNVFHDNMLLSFKAAFVLAHLLPYVTILICSSLMIGAVIRLSRPSLEQQEQTPRVTLTLILMSTVFLVLTFPEIIIYAIWIDDMSLEYYSPKYYYIMLNYYPLLSRIITFLWATDSSIKFCIYILSSTKFRGEVKRMFSRVNRACTRTRNENQNVPEEREMAVFI